MISAVFKDFIQIQISSFTKGFSKVMKLESLKLFLIGELESVICGEDQSNWDLEMLESSIKPDHGYTTESEPYMNLL